MSLEIDRAHRQRIAPWQDIPRGLESPCVWCGGPQDQAHDALRVSMPNHVSMRDKDRYLCGICARRIYRSPLWRHGYLWADICRKLRTLQSVKRRMKRRVA